MVASSVTVWAPPDNGNLPNNVVRPGITVAWTGGVGPFNVRYTWDDDPTFANGNGRRQVVTNTSVTSPDTGYPTADLALLTAGTTWYVKADVIDTGDSNAELSDTDNDFTYLDPNDQNRYRYLLANVGFGFDDQDNPAGGWGTSIGGTAGPDGQNNPSLLRQYRYLLANVGVAFHAYDEPASGWGTGIGGTEGVDGNWKTTNRHLYLLGNVGVGFDPIDRPAGGWNGNTGLTSQAPADGYAIDFNRHLYLLANVDTTQPCPYLFSLSTNVVEQGQGLTLSGQGLVSATSPTADAWGAEVRLYESASHAAAYLVLPISSYVAGATEDTIQVTIPGGAASGYVAVVHTSGTPSCTGSNFKQLTVIAVPADSQAGWWVEVWELRNDSAVVRPLPDVAAADFEHVANDVGRGSITLPAAHPDIADIIDRTTVPEVQKLVKVYLHDRFAYAFIPWDLEEPYSDDGARPVRIYGEGQEGILRWARCLWKDYPAQPAQARTWLYGSSTNILPEGDMEPDSGITNGGAEDAVREPWANLLGASLFASTDEQRTGSYSLRVTPPVVGAGAAAEFTVEDGFRAYVDLWVKDPTAAGDDITADVLDPASSVSITRSGSTATVDHTGHGYTSGQTVAIYGCTQTEYNGEWTITVTDADTYTYTLTGTPATPATGDPTAALVLATSTVQPTTAQWYGITLTWVPDAGGSQQTETCTLRVRYTDTVGTPHDFYVDDAASYARPNFDLTRARVTIGLSRDYAAGGLHSLKYETQAGGDVTFNGTVTAFAVEPNRDYTVTWRVMGTVGEQINIGLRLGGIRSSQTLAFTGLGTWDTITLQGTAGPDESSGRFAIAGIESTAMTFYVDEITITPGQPAATAGAIVGDILAAAQARGTLTFVQVSFTDSLDTNGDPWPETLQMEVQPEWTLWDLCEKLIGFGYDVELVPVNWRAGGDSGWILNLYGPLGAGTNWSADTEGPAILPSNTMHDAVPSAAPPAATVVYAEGADGVWTVAEVSAARLTALERREDFIVNQGAVEQATLARAAQHSLDVATTRGAHFSGDITDAADPLPYLDFRPFDRLRASLPTDGNRVQVADDVYRVAAITARLTATGRGQQYEVDFGRYRLHADRLRDLLLGRLIGRSSTELYQPGVGSVSQT